jgi:hypothetical protein
MVVQGDHFMPSFFFNLSSGMCGLIFFFSFFFFLFSFYFLVGWGNNFIFSVGCDLDINRI